MDRQIPAPQSATSPEFIWDESWGPILVPGPERRVLGESRPCAFCFNNEERRGQMLSHPLKDVNGRVVCPVLRRYKCPTCGATGDFAHTQKYCPEDSRRRNIEKPQRYTAAGRYKKSYN